MAKIEMKYMFLKKEKKNNSFRFNIFKDMFIKLFQNVKDECFDIKINSKIYTIYYEEKKEPSQDIYYLDLFIDNTKYQGSLVLDTVNNKLIKGEHRKEYNIINTFDGVSMYYCDKIYPKINLFERKIRQLIYIIVVKSLGTEWYKETVHNKLDEKIKEQTKGINESKLIESALSEMTIFQLEDYLFSQNREMEFNKVIDENLNDDKLENMSKEDIICIIKKSRSKSIWEVFFEGKIKMNNLQENLIEIRAYRNKVAHSKPFYKDDYDKFNLLLNQLISQINEAIKDVEVKTFDELDMAEIIASLSKGFVDLSERIRRSLILNSDMLENMRESFIKLGENVNNMYPNLQQQENMKIGFSKLSEVARIMDPDLYQKKTSKDKLDKEEND